MKEVSPMLPLLPDLYYLFAPDWRIEADEIVSHICRSKIRVLTLQSYHQMSVYVTSSLVSLTIYFCYLSELLSIFNNTTMLKYLKINRLIDYDIRYDDNVNYKSKPREIYAVHLKQLSLGLNSATFERLAVVLQCFPNLEIFSIVAQQSYDITNGDRWQYLIESSLPLLRIFNFYFDCSNNEISMNFSTFQTDFWHKHHWYTSYVIYNGFTSIYTIPYTYNYFKLTSTTKKYNNSLMNDLNEFDGVKNLTICTSALRDNSSWYFKNVQSLSLINTDNHNHENDEDELKQKHTEYLNKIVNLSNITELNITERCLISPEILLEILRQMPNISSLKLKEQITSSFDDDYELYELLNRKIKILHFSSNLKYSYTDYNFLKIKDLDSFCKIFSNVEELHCYIDNVDDFLFILTKCSKLSVIHVNCVIEKVYRWFENNALGLNVYINYKSNCPMKDDDIRDNSRLIQLMSRIKMSRDKNIENQNDTDTENLNVESENDTDIEW
jgi:hypothetical protein